MSEFRISVPHASSSGKHTFCLSEDCSASPYSDHGNLADVAKQFSPLPDSGSMGAELIRIPTHLLTEIGHVTSSQGLIRALLQNVFNRTLRGRSLFLERR